MLIEGDIQGLETVQWLVKSSECGRIRPVSILIADLEQVRLPVLRRLGLC